MATYAQIAQETWTRSREYGSDIQVRLTIEEKGASAADLNIPLIQDIEIQHGSRKDTPDKPIRVSQMTLQLKDEQSAGSLLEKLDNSGFKQFRVTCENITDGRIEFQGFVEGDQTKFGLYEKVQSLKVKAVGQIATLNDTAASDSRKTIADLADSINANVDIDRELDVYTTMRHQGKNLSDPFPKEIDFNEKQLTGAAPDETGTLLQAMKSLAHSFGMQWFQHNGRLVLREVYESAFNGSAMNKYESDGAGGYTQKTEDHQVTLDKSNVIKGGEYQNIFPVKKQVQQLRLTEGDFQFDDVNSDLITQWQDATVFTPSVGLLVGGDEIEIVAEGTIAKDPNSNNDVTYDARPVSVKINNLTAGGQDLWYDFANDEWLTSQAWYEEQLGFVNLPDAPDSADWGFDRFKMLASVPDGVIGMLQVRHHFDGHNFLDGSATDLDNSKAADIRIKLNRDDEAEVYHLATAQADVGRGDTAVQTLHVGDDNDFGNQKVFRYLNAGSFVATINWLDSDGNGSLHEITSRRLGKVSAGKGQKFTVQIRDKEKVSLLTQFKITDNWGNLRTALPLQIKYQILKGYYEVHAAEVMDQVTTETLTYSPEALSSTTPGTARSSSGGGDGSAGGPATTGGDHGQLGGLDDPTDHLWAMQTDFSNIDSETPEGDRFVPASRQDAVGKITSNLDGSYTDIPTQLYTTLRQGAEYFIVNEATRELISIIPTADGGPGKIDLFIEEQLITAAGESYIVKSPAFEETESNVKPGFDYVSETLEVIDDELRATMDLIEQGATWAKVGADSVNLVSGEVLLSGTEGDLDDIPDGSNYAKVDTIQVSASGLVLLSVAEGNLDDIDDGGTYGRVQQASLDASGLVLVSGLAGDLDDLADGTNYAKVDSANLTAGGLVLLSASSGDLDDISDGTNYAKVDRASLTSGGLVLLSAVSGDMDDLADGSSYARVKSTNVSAGNIKIVGPDGQTVIDQGQIYTDQFFASQAEITARLTMGSNSELVSQNYLDTGGSEGYLLKANSGQIVYGAMGGSLSNKIIEAPFGQNTIDPIDNDEWFVSVNTTGSGNNNDDEIPIGGQYRHRFGINKLILFGYAKTDITVTSGDGIFSRSHIIYFAVYDQQYATKLNEDSISLGNLSYQSFTLTLDLSSSGAGLTPDQDYFIEIRLYASLNGDASNDPTDEANAQTYLRENYNIDKVT